MGQIKVNSAFDGGSIDIVDVSDCANLQFAIRADTNSHFRQWFYFELTHVINQPLNIVLGLKDTAYPEGWRDYNVVMSYDNCNWQRLKSNCDGEQLRFTLTPTEDQVYFAYFEPYTYAQHLALIDYAATFSQVQHRVLGCTLQKRNMDLLVVGNEAAQHKVWITARQHPGETMAEWFMEGLIYKLVNEYDPVSCALLKDCVFYLVPNMNPDGACNGNLRVNSVGANLNREWQTPTLEKSPEVYYVREHMQKTGVDMFFDIHGDEAIPYVFTAGCDENPSFSDKQRQASTKFSECLQGITPDYQTQFGYGVGQFGSETMTMATNWVGDRFDCLAYTLEMPFKDNNDLPDAVHGFSGNRAAALGESILTALYSFFK